VSIPDEVRTAILNCTKLVRNRGFPGDLVDVIMLLDWLQSQPTAPEPDWSQAPEWAQWWAFDTHNVGFWYAEEPHVMAGKWESNHGMIVWDGAYSDDLPIGIDWRTTLRKRPEAA